MAAMLAAEPDVGSDPDSHAADATGQLTSDTLVQAGRAQLCELAPGFSVYTVCPDEARFIHGEIFAQRCYLRHGITINAGDTVVDCGNTSCCKRLCRYDTHTRQHLLQC